MRLIADAVADPDRAGTRLRTGLRAARWLHSAERRLVGDAVRDALRWGHLLGETPEATWERWLAWRTGVDDAPDRAIAALVDAGDVATLAGVPEPVADQLRRRFGDQACAFVLASNARAPLALRTNAGRTTRDALAARLASEGHPTTPSAVAPHGLLLVGSGNPEDGGAFRDGWFEVQDESSQAIAAWAAEGAGPGALDLCAGAGGKALALAAAGLTVTAADIRPEPLDELARRAARAGARIRTRALDPDGALPADWRDRFDLVLVDAPCTGTGVWRRHPELRARAARWPAVAALQARILARAAGAVCPGGRLVYATCSVLPAEDEDVFEAFLAAHPAFRRAADDRHFAPHTGSGDGFYAATAIRG